MAVHAGHGAHNGHGGSPAPASRTAIVSGTGYSMAPAPAARVARRAALPRGPAAGPPPAEPPTGRIGRRRARALALPGANPRPRPGCRRPPRAERGRGTGRPNRQGSRVHERRPGLPEPAPPIHGENRRFPWGTSRAAAQAVSRLRRASVPARTPTRPPLPRPLPARSMDEPCGRRAVARSRPGRWRRPPRRHSRSRAARLPR